MAGPFEYFVVFAEMRTGSNFLEANLNAVPGISCHGEAFNPHFIGYPERKDLLGVTQAARDADPGVLLRRIREEAGICGFRYFHDHDPRVLDGLLENPKCAKIILTRNPADSYVSWKIAQATGQWKLTDMKRRKAAQAVFDPDEFARHLEALQAFQVTLLNRLQVSGQTAFYVAYEDLQNLDVMNGLARFLGAEEQLEALDKTLKVQNPSPISSKVQNFAAMEAALSGLDRFNLTRTPNFEPRRVAAVPTYVAAAKAGMLYLPIRSGPEDAVKTWMAALDGVSVDDLVSRMPQKALRQWKRANKGHRSFTVLRHPVARAHHAFCRHILGTGPESFGPIRQTLIKRYDVALPKDGPGEGYDLKAHRAAFKAFLRFLAGNLTGQTTIRVDASWCTQSQAMQGFGDFALPDLVIREDEMGEELTRLAQRLGYDDPPDVMPDAEPGPVELAEAYDAEIEELTAKAYQRDYMMFGLTSWA